MKRRKGMWDYLDKSGVLEWGTDEQIKQAKKEYRKRYLSEYKRAQRTRRKEFVISLDVINGEFSKIRKASATHNRSIPEFIKLAVLAYLDQRFLVPNPYQVARLEQMLAQILNEVHVILENDGNFYGNNNITLGILENRIEQLENEINRIFRNPELINSHNDSQSKIA